MAAAAVRQCAECGLAASVGCCGQRLCASCFYFSPHSRHVAQVSFVPFPEVPEAGAVLRRNAKALRDGETVGLPEPQPRAAHFTPAQSAAQRDKRDRHLQTRQRIERFHQRVTANNNS